MSQLVETSLVTRLHRIFERIQQRLIDQATIPFEIKLWGGQSSYRFGKGQPVVTVVVKDRNGLLALSGFDEVEICEAYMAGSLDVVGDMLKFVGLRRMLRDSHPLHTLWHRLMPLFIGREQTDRQAIANHYDFSNEFYLSFMDPTRCYSQAVFERDDERLESAQRRKLDFAVESCRLKPGDRVLDIGGGWGAFTEHAGRRGIQVTSLTVSRQSELFMIDLM
ncbi:MAG: class I SAM-dependent methyltransferase [Pseudomonadota bacterium]